MHLRDAIIIGKRVKRIFGPTAPNSFHPDSTDGFQTRGEGGSEGERNSAAGGEETVGNKKGSHGNKKTGRRKKNRILDYQTNRRKSQYARGGGEHGMI